MCKHCRANALAGALPGELTYEQGLDLIDQVANFGRPYPILVLTGGDCLLRPDLSVSTIDELAQGRFANVLDEIDDLDPRDFTLASVPARFADLGDLHASIDDVSFRLDQLLDWADRDGIEPANFQFVAATPGSR